MSAYVVSKSHIDALVRATKELNPSFDGSRHGCPADLEADLTQFDKLGAMLWAENVKSVSYRYKDSKGDLPGPKGGVDPSTYRYVWQKAKRLDAVGVLKAIRGYVYQSCEHPEWEGSHASVFCEYLQGLAINKLPGYDDAEWEVGPAEPNQPVSLLDLASAPRKGRR